MNIWLVFYCGGNSDTCKSISGSGVRLDSKWLIFMCPNCHRIKINHTHQAQDLLFQAWLDSPRQSSVNISNNLGKSSWSSGGISCASVSAFHPFAEQSLVWALPQWELQTSPASASEFGNSWNSRITLACNFEWWQIRSVYKNELFIKQARDSRWQISIRFP